METIIEYSLYTTLILSVIMIVVILKRQRKTTALRGHIIDLCNEHDNRLTYHDLQEKGSSLDWFYREIPNADTMVFQLWKPLKLEHWATDEMINKLKE